MVDRRMWELFYVISCLMMSMENVWAQAPSSPRNITMLGHSSKSIDIQWKAPSVLNGDVTQFRIVYSFSLDGIQFQSKQLLINDTNVRRVRLDNLYPYVRYHIEISERTTTYGPSANASFKTAQGVPQGKPENFTVIRINSTSADVAWKPLPKYIWGGIPKKYLIYIQGDNEKPKDVPWNQSSYTLTGLTPNTSYVVGLLPSSEIGTGDNTQVEIEFRTSLTGPSKPRNITILQITDTNLKITWLGPVDVNEIESYYIFVFQNGVLYLKKIVNALVTTTTIVNLQPETSYQLKIRGFNGEFGEMSNPLQFKTEPVKIKDKSKHTGIIIGILVPLCIIGLFLILYVYYQHRQSRQKPKYESKEPLVTKIDDYPNYGNSGMLSGEQNAPKIPMVIKNNSSTPSASAPVDLEQPAPVPTEDVQSPDNSSTPSASVPVDLEQPAPVPTEDVQSPDSTSAPSATALIDLEQPTPVPTEDVQSPDNSSTPSASATVDLEQPAPVPTEDIQSPDNSGTPSASAPVDLEQPAPVPTEDVQSPDNSSTPSATAPVDLEQAAPVPTEDVQSPDSTSVPSANAPVDLEQPAPVPTEDVQSHDNSSTPTANVPLDLEQPAPVPMEDVQSPDSTSARSPNAPVDLEQAAPVSTEDVQSPDSTMAPSAITSNDFEKPASVPTEEDNLLDFKSMQV